MPQKANTNIRTDTKTGHMRESFPQLPSNQGSSFFVSFHHPFTERTQCAIMRSVNVKSYSCVATAFLTKGATRNGNHTRPAEQSNAGFRHIPICDELYVMLKRYREQQGKGKRIVFSKRDEDAYTHPQVFRGKVFKYWCYDADLPKDITPHSGRHYFAYRLFLAGVNPETLRHLTGHSDISTLLDVYCHIDKLSDETLVEARHSMSALCG